MWSLDFKIFGGKWSLYLTIPSARVDQVLISAAASLHGDWPLRVSHVFADVIAVGRPYEDGWGILELLELFASVVFRYST